MPSISLTEREPPPATPPTLDGMVRMVASPGGFLGRRSDGFPGPQTLWIVHQRTADFMLALAAQRSVGEGRLPESESHWMIANLNTHSS